VTNGKRSVQTICFAPSSTARFCLDSSRISWSECTSTVRTNQERDVFLSSQKTQEVGTLFSSFDNLQNRGRSFWFIISVLHAYSLHFALDSDEKRSTDDLSQQGERGSAIARQRSVNCRITVFYASTRNSPSLEAIRFDPRDQRFFEIDDRNQVEKMQDRITGWTGWFERTCEPLIFTNRHWFFKNWAFVKPRPDSDFFCNRQKTV
jgi:hypothetical protein